MPLKRAFDCVYPMRHRFAPHHNNSKQPFGNATDRQIHQSVSLRTRPRSRAKCGRHREKQKFRRNMPPPHACAERAYETVDAEDTFLLLLFA
ncbi:hypothetical protein G7Y89_g10048 [Cudoniella acicularis]|uniref:Uncharacterized protein n=1 Tax=Cudoniella acicularis TaxID=354080 RepID=A0A8H4RG78_9HELO|nr:hypothetical protein G7Y89_g10048 [Cudoniella acicularis]